MSTIPQPTFGPTGFQAPDESDILSAVQADLDTAFGGGMNMDLSTPQGQLAETITACVGDKNDVFIAYTNQVDPQFAQGRMQDAIGRLYFMTRFPATPTRVTLTCVGLSGTPLNPAAAFAKDAAGNVYTPSVGGTIPVGGTIDLEFENLVNGPIPAPAGTVNRIHVAVPGWDSVTNAADGVPGQNVESAQAFEARRRQSVAGNSTGRMLSIFAAVFASGADLPSPNIPRDVYVTENWTDSPMTVGGVSLVEHSMYVAVLGGDDDEIAKAIWSKKDPGCDYNGNTTINVEDLNYSPPIVYPVIFERPTGLNIYVAVSIVNDPALPSNIATLVKDAVVAASLGEDGGEPMRIGATVYASRYYAPVAAVHPAVRIISIFVGTAASPTSPSVSVNINRFGETDTSRVTLTLV